MQDIISNRLSTGGFNDSFFKYDTYIPLYLTGIRWVKSFFLSWFKVFLPTGKKNYTYRNKFYELTTSLPFVRKMNTFPQFYSVPFVCLLPWPSSFLRLPHPIYTAASRRSFPVRRFAAQGDFTSVSRFLSNCSQVTEISLRSNKINCGYDTTNLY